MKVIIALIFFALNLEASASECGLVKWYEADKGFGFIKPLNKRNGEDLFVTWQSVMPREDGLSTPLQENEKVVYDRVEGPDGIQAEKVKVVRDFPQGICR